MSEICKKLHILFNNMERLKFPFDKNRIPENGIYILFEKGEKGHNKDRIVRVGTHTGENQLIPRIKQHFSNENKDRSIFRKNIGRVLLNKNKDSYSNIWELQLTTKKSKEKYGKLIDKQKQKDIEKDVTDYIRENFSFVVFSIEKKEKRLEIESKIISTVSLCKECGPSDIWFGLNSPKEKIRKSGLWLVNELYKKAFDSEDIKELIEIIESN